MVRMIRIVCVLLLLTLISIFFMGCSKIRYTHPPRTAREQFLLSYAGIQSINKMSINALKDEKVFVDASHFESIDKEFMIGQIRARLLSRGALITDSKDDATIIAEIRSAGVGINTRESMLGMPEIPLPVPGAGMTISIPEIPIFKYISDTGKASLALTAYEKNTGRFICSAGPTLGKTKKTDWNFLGIVISFSKNLPREKTRGKDTP